VILALDTSTLQSGVALVDGDGRVVAARTARVTTHSETLLPMIRDVLAEAGIDPRAGAGPLSAIACGAGPGSFTGLRIGLATAKGLCLALERPLVMVSSLQALALRAPPGELAVPCIDAFKGEVYAGFYRRDAAGGAPHAEAPEAVLAPERLAAILVEKLRAGPVRLVGDAVDRWPALNVPGAGCDDRAPPDAADVGRLAGLRVARGDHDDLAAAIPSYIRPSEAEIHGPKRQP
jgi:tRNA threonylcarbamoyladenosine biosynthesis protein TsaB